MTYTHLDAAESAFFSRELEHVYSRTYDIKYPNLMARMLVPTINEAPGGALSVTYEQYDRVGKAKITAPGAVDAPRVDVFGTEFTRPVRLVTDSYGYHLLEIRQAAMAGKPLNARKAAAARRAIEEVLDEVAAIGAPEYGISEGFINNSAVAVDSAAGVWSSATADAIIADVSQLYENMSADTKSVEWPDTLVLPPAQYAKIAMMPRSTNSDKTVLMFLLDAIPELRSIEKWYRMEGAGAGAVDRAMVYRRSPDYVAQEIPSEFEQLPVFQKGQNFEIECMATTAGTVFYYPRSARYLDGI